MSQPPKTAKDIFLAALDVEPAERAALLDDLCARDTALRRQVEALLRVHDEPDSFLDSPRIDLGLSDDPGNPNVGPTTDQIGPTIDQPITEGPGTVIGPYKLLQKIGEGGFGVVYMADQTEPVKRRVALKIIKPGMDTRRVIARFEAERQALAMMDHPNIARVLDAGTTDSGRPYFVMDLVNGVPITQYCDEHHLTPRERLELFVPVCRAIQHAHQKGVIHRDIKPTNMLVAEYDDRAVPKIIDFGVAKATEQRLTERTMFTQLGQVVGTLDYMSPEQAKLNQFDIDTRSDIYSLGVVLYVLLAGEMPFDRERLRSAAFDELLRIIREEEPPRPSLRLSTSGSLPSIAANRHTEPKKLSALVHGELDWIVMKALEKDRTRRYETANGFANDIKRYLNDEPVVACPPSAGYRFRKFARRNKPAIVTGSLIALTLILGLVGTSWQAIRATRARKQEAVQRIAAVAAREKEAIARQDAETAAERERQARREIRRHLYVADMNRVQYAWDRATVDFARELLDRHLPISGEEDLRGFEWYYFWQKLHPSVLTLHGAGRVAFSPDGKTLATTSLGHRPQRGQPANTENVWDTVELRDAQTGKVTRTLRGHTDNVHCLTFSPDNKTLATGSDDCTVKLWDVSTGELLASLKGHKGRVTSVVFSADGGLLASGSRDSTTKLWHVPGYEEKLTIPGPGIVESAAFSPEGKLLAVGRLRNALEIRDTETGELRRKLATGPTRSVAFSPDGALLAVGGGSGFRLWDWTTAEPKATLQQGESTAVVLAVAFSPDGRKVASAGYDRAVRLWSVPDGQAIATYKGHSWWVYSLSFSPDGSALASAGADGITNVWPVTDDIPGDILRAHNGKVYSVVFSPDSRWVASASADGTVKLWDVNTGNLKHILEHGTPAGAVAFSPEGSVLASASHSGGVVKLWSVDAGVLVATLTGRRDTPKVNKVSYYLHGVAFSPNGKTLAAAGMEESVELWDVSNKEQIATFTGHTGFVQSVAFSPDGDTLASGASDTTVKLWDLASRRLRLTLRGHSDWVYCISFSPDGKTLASASRDQTVKLWDARTGKLLRTLKGDPEQVCTVTFSPDGKTLATGGLDKTIRLWDVPTAQVKAVLNGHGEGVYSLAFSLDGATLASAGVDGTVRLWRAPRDAENQRPYERAEQLFADPVYLAQGYCQQGQWAKAANDLSESIRIDPEREVVHYWHALAYLGAGDRKGYLDGCARMMQQFAGDETASAAHWLAWSCALAPGAVSDLAEAVKAAEYAVSKEPDSDQHLNTLGAILYRADRYQESVERMNEIAERKPEGIQYSPVYTWFFLAMAHHRLGHEEEGQRWLKRAIDRAEEEMRDNSTVAWNRRLTLDLLRAEAEALLVETQVDSGPPDEDGPQ